MKRAMLGLALCGGASSRMGENKALLEVRPGVTQLEYALGLLGLVCSRVAAGVGRERREDLALPAGVEQVVDEREVGGPMASVLGALRGAGDKAVLVIACDMPFLEASLLVQLVNRRDREAFATAFVAGDGAPEPLCAVYEPRCLAAMEALAREGKTSLRRFLLDVAVERIALERPQLLASVNERSQLEAARRHFASR